MTLPSDQPHPVAEAMRWVSRITTVALEMVLPGLAGQWLDERLGTGFLGITGFALGLTTGIWHLMVMTGAVRRKPFNDSTSPRDRPHERPREGEDSASHDSVSPKEDHDR